jgi:hypothetical protein
MLILNMIEFYKFKVLLVYAQTHVRRKLKKTLHNTDK